MPLINLKTDLKSLGYGDDRPGGASNNQPYIQTPIPEGIGVNSPDFLLRNGILNPLDSLEDVSRLTKYFLDSKSPNGLLFIAKQELLERQNVNVADGINRLYNPLGTVAQAGVLSIGYHLNKQGFNVFREGYYTGGDTGYFKFTTTANTLGEDRLSLLFKSKVSDTLTTLEALAGKNLYGLAPSLDISNLLSYSGGPGSFLGLGKTNIRLQNPTRTVESINEDQKFLITFGSTDPKNKFYLNPNTPSPNWLYRTIQNDGVSGWGASAEYIDLASGGDSGEQQNLNNSIFGINPENFILNRNITDTIYTPKDNLNGDNNEYTFTYPQLESQPSKGSDRSTNLISIVDFRSTFLSSSSDIPYSNYNKFNREKGVGNGGYGTSQTFYKPVERALNPNLSVSPDNAELGVLGEDIIDFNFRLINNQSSQNTTIDFRAYIEDFQDSYNATWDPFKYVGRADNFYKYSGFNRQFNVTFVVPALSRADMIGNYQKLNALAWATMPDYKDTEFGYMKGNFVKLIMGDYFKGVPAIINSLTYSPIMEMGFDINRYSAQDESNNSQHVEGTNIKRDDSSLFVGQLPKGIRVQTQLTIIHTFVPQRGKTFIGWSEGGDNGRYIINEDGTEGENVRVSEKNNYVANKPDINNMEGLFG